MGAGGQLAPMSAAERADAERSGEFLRRALTELLGDFGQRGALTAATTLLGSVLASITALAPDDAPKAEFIEGVLDLVREYATAPLEAPR